MKTLKETGFVIKNKEIFKCYEAMVEESKQHFDFPWDNFKKIYIVGERAIILS